MITTDIETTGLDPVKNSILSIGAVAENGDEFYIEVCAKDSDVISRQALDINGFTIEQCRDKTKATQEQAYVALIEFCKKHNDFLLGGQNVGSFDVLFLKEISKRVEFIKWPFGYRTIDLHSVAYAKDRSSNSLDGILINAGLSAEPKPHNALNGAKLEKAAFDFYIKK